MPFQKKIRNSRGSILIVCFFVLMLLSMFALTVGYTVRQKLQFIMRIDTRQKLRSLADAGAQKAIYVLLTHRKDPSNSFDALNQTWSQNEGAFKDIKVGEGEFSIAYAIEEIKKETRDLTPSCRYGLVDEERKIHLNRVPIFDIFERLFMEVAGLSRKDARDLADAIVKWKTPSTNNLGGGSGYYAGLNPPYAPRFGEFATLRELLWVKGMQEKIYQKIKPHLTLYGSGAINLNTATRPVLVALGIAPALCDQIMDYRRGRDKIEGTKDDQNFTHLNHALEILAQRSYLDHNAFEFFKTLVQSGVITMRSRMFSAHIVGKLPYKRQKIQLTVFFDDTGVIQGWEEEFITSSSSLC